MVKYVIYLTSFLSINNKSAITSSELISTSDNIYNPELVVAPVLVVHYLPRLNDFINHRNDNHRNDKTTINATNQLNTFLWHNNKMYLMEYNILLQQTWALKEIDAPKEYIEAIEEYFGKLQ